MYTQLCVATGIDMSAPNSKDAFTRATLEKLNTRIRIAEVVKTLPDTDENGLPVPDTGGRTDILFYVHDDDCSYFSTARFKVGRSIRWWEDVLDSGGGRIYPPYILQKYAYTWPQPS